RQGDRPRDDRCAAQGRDGEVLWRRHQPQEEAAGKAEEGQGADAGIRQREYSAGGFRGGAQDGGRITAGAQATFAQQTVAWKPVALASGYSGRPRRRRGPTGRLCRGVIPGPIGRALVASIPEAGPWVSAGLRLWSVRGRSAGKGKRGHHAISSSRCCASGPI